MPIINSNRPLVVLNDNFSLPEVPIAPNGTDMAGCILNNAQVIPNTVEAFQTGCDGPMCDQNTLLQNDVLSNRCACMQMDKSGKVMISMGLEVRGGSGDSFRVQFASKWFMKTFIYSGALPMGTKASDFNSYEVEERLYDAVASVFRYINEHGGFRIYLWVRRGEIKDQGVDQPNRGLAWNAERATVESGLIKHHIVRMEPANPAALDVDALEGFKFNVSSGFNTA